MGGTGRAPVGVAVLLVVAVGVGSASGSRAVPGHLPNAHVWGCYNISKQYPFCDSGRPIFERVSDLVERLTDVEKVQLLSPDVSGEVSSCSMMDMGVERLGIPGMLNLVEMNGAVAACCLADGKCSARYPGPTGIAASFNTTMWRQKGEVLSTEFRAFNNLEWYRCVDTRLPDKVGLTGYGPNINIMRDPRWGRNSEVPSEDPFLAGEYAMHYVRGGQEGEDMRYTKVAMSLKHYTAYSVENNRGAFAPNISMHDLWETFLSGYERGMQKDGGNATGVMCSYVLPNGVPACANDYLLNKVLREAFDRPDAVVGTDCGAFNNMVNNHYASSELDAARLGLIGGSDLEFGDVLWTPKAFGGKGLLEEVVSQNHSTVLPTLNQAVTRVLTTRFKTGMFDDVADQPYTKIGAEVVNSTEHWKANLDATLQSLVLLKNANSTLPLTAANAGKWVPAQARVNLSLIGPHLESRMQLLSDYGKWDEACFDGTYDCVWTIADFFRMHTEREQGHFVSSLQIAKGVDLDSNDTSNIGQALLAASNSDVVVFFGGLNSQTIETEGTDRTKVTLPGLQGNLLDLILGLPNKPRVVVVLINGGAISLGKSVLDKVHSVVEAFYPSVRGPEALYRTIFGESNAWGRLPFTMYTAETVAALDMNNFDMSLAPGRTYKYLTQTPEFAFGHGLSYTTFSVSQCTAGTVVAKNTGAVDGAAVVMLFARPGPDVRASVGSKHPVPLKFLIGFDRVNLAPGASYTMVLIGQRYHSLDESLKLYNEDGVRVWYPGTYYLDFFDGVNTCTYTYKL